ncbi:type II toxin-antitoxin system antitoxin SocA domain-containing protein [Lysinibacillus sp. FSL K6-0057]|uniref:Panacea domain-containing protein n=1 Tax=Lysinibacillus sp. FSL K6-0057 TaxID=2921411 RepID=UPI00315A27E4
MNQKEDENMYEVISTEKLEVNKVSAYLFNTPECHFSNSMEGNMKLQKLLTFANLIHYAQYNDFLFENDMYAFKNGVVVEDVRIPYFTNYYGYKESLQSYSTDFTEEQINSIDMSISIFNKLSAKELSDIQHELITWQVCYDNSLVGNRYEKELGKIDRSSIKVEDIEKLRKMINSFKENNEEDYLIERINGITFYYEESEIPVSKKDILDYLALVSGSEVNGEDDTFFLAFDEDQGLYHY